MNLFEHLNQRGLIHNFTPNIEQYFAQAKQKNETPRVYIGFDPSGASLQIGNLLAILLLRRAQLHNVQPIVLLGGATGLIGDPSGKKAERTLLKLDTANENTVRIKKQIESLIDLSPGPVQPIFLNNLDWFSKINFVEFLRDVGKHLTINYMIAKDSVKLRMETGISYAEFGYMLMQGYDYLHLFENYGCKVQMGGSDQWGNTTTGIELIRRKHSSETHALSSPLLTDASGNKLGKTESGAIYLDPEMTTPYQFYQYFLQREDSEVIKLLNALTLLDLEIIAEAQSWVKAAPDKREAQKLLAKTLTIMIHGIEQFEACEKASQVLFSKDPTSLQKLSEPALQALAKEVPSSNLDVASLPILDLLVKTKLCSSKSEARRHINSGAVTINRVKILDEKLLVGLHSFSNTNFILIGLGKTQLHLILKSS